MGDRSGIQWCDATWNPTRGCSRVSEGCRNCYAERQAVRLSGPGMQYEGLVRSTSDGPKWTGKVVLVERMLRVPLQWRRPRRIFVNSMSDLFHEKLSDASIDEVFAVMALAKQHTFMILTKRPERMRDYFLSSVDREGRYVDQRVGLKAFGRVLDEYPKLQRAAGGLVMTTDPGTEGSIKGWPLPNVWLGVSVESPGTADWRVPLLLETPAAVRFLSCEPLLGPLELYRWMSGYQGGDAREPGRGLDWIIAGGESGPGSRPMDTKWVRTLREQCEQTRTPFFFKQYGDWIPEDEADAILTGGAVRIPTWAGEKRVVYGRSFVRVGKTAAGNLLDGVTHEAFPA